MRLASSSSELKTETDTMRLPRTRTRSTDASTSSSSRPITLTSNLSPSSSPASSRRPWSHHAIMTARLLLLSIALLPILSLPAVVRAAEPDSCIFELDEITFDFSKLKGVSTVVVKEKQPPSWANTTWLIDPCGYLPFDKDKYDPTNDCPEKTQICGIEKHNLISKPNDPPATTRILPVAGDIENGEHSKPKTTRIKPSEGESSENGKGGLQVEYSGGWYPESKQKAIIKYICDKEKTGLEGQKPREKREDEKEGGAERSLKFVSYGDATLTLEWRTQYACEKRDGDGGENKGGADGGSHWGFFTWFIIIVFMGTAAYLIFGSWLNYNRYGARGWDLLPHGDTIRDIPYLFKDFIRKVVNTVQTGGRSSRAGYSAV